MPYDGELLDRLFEQAAGLPPEERAAFLEQNCADPALRSELQSLLPFAAGSTVTINEAIKEAAAAVELAALSGRRVGSYRLLGRIGMGGMGAVYRAARDDDEFQKTVAIKILRFAHADLHEIEQFRRERQILATLEHPNIARLLDGGTWTSSEGGVPQPYLVMEYVDGLTLTRYCEQNRLTVRQRVELFSQVCAAVSYAHQRLVVHRDIKPANILVTGDGTPKLLDFGIAKLVAAGGQPEETATALGLRPMTPDYASPEQVRGDAISTMSDVYSLGAVLYETLTGCRPHDIPEYEPLQIMHAVCERDVPSPSSRGKRELRGDLDIIVLTAMQREPARRYRSVEQFSEDIRRYLEGLPILARADTLFYRAGKFVRRRRGGVAAVAGIFLSLVSAVVVSTREARRANTEAATASAVNDFLENDLLSQAGVTAQAGSGSDPDPDLKVRTVLDRAAARVQGRFAGRPLVEASIRSTLGDAYSDLGLFPQARFEFERALQLRRSALGDNAPATLKSMMLLGGVHLKESHFAMAETVLKDASTAQRRILGEENLDTLDSLSSLAAVYKNEGKYPEAEALYVRVLDLYRRVLGRDHHKTFTVMNNLAVLYGMQGKFAQAKTVLSETVATSRRVLGEEHPDTLATVNNLAEAYRSEGDYAQAESLLTPVLTVENRIFGATHPRTLETMDSLAFNYRDWGKYPESAALFEKIIDARRQILGNEHWDTLNAMNNLGTVYSRQGKYGDAAALFARVAEAYRRTLGPENFSTLNSEKNLAMMYGYQGRYAQAETLLKANVETCRRALGRAAPHTLFSLSALGRVYFLQRKYADAEPLFTEVFAERRRVHGEDNPETLDSLAMLSRVRLRQRRYAELEEQLRGSLKLYDERHVDTWRRYDLESIMGQSVAAQKKYSDAEPFLIAGYDGMLERRAAIPAYDGSALAEAADSLTRLYAQWQKPDRAAAWRTKVGKATLAPR